MFEVPLAYRPIEHATQASEQTVRRDGRSTVRHTVEQRGNVAPRDLGLPADEWDHVAVEMAAVTLPSALLRHCVFLDVEVRDVLHRERCTLGLPLTLWIITERDDAAKP
jgi:hypothetical protein